MNRILLLAKVMLRNLFKKDGVKPAAYPLNLADYQPSKLDNPNPTVLAADIPVAKTPPGGYRRQFPPMILADCDEPLASGAPDVRGVWLCTSGKMVGHVERIEQAGNRVCITAGGIIHDGFFDGTLENGVHDINLQTGMEIHVAGDLKDGQIHFRPGGKRFVAVKRYLDGDDLIWQYGIFKNRLIKLEAPLPEWQVSAKSTIPAHADQS